MSDPKIDPQLEAPSNLRRIQGVDYFRFKTASGGDLFLTDFGLPLRAQLEPENWYEPRWFEAHRQKLRGTSTIYRVQSKPAEGKSLDLVVRFNRVGQDLPVDTLTLDRYTHAEFNSPFEEVAALMALRSARFGPHHRRIPTKHPLAIYSPPSRLALWQSGRKEHRIVAKQARAPEAQLDIERQYLLVYGWIKGIDAQDAAGQIVGGGDPRKAFLAEAMNTAVGEMEEAGFRVLDMKPAHIIVRFTPSGQLIRRPDGTLMYALIDYELLEPIPIEERKAASSDPATA